MYKLNLFNYVEIRPILKDGENIAIASFAQFCPERKWLVSI